MGFCNAVGREAIEGLRFLASLPHAGAGRKKTKHFILIHSRLFTVEFIVIVNLILMEPSR